MNTIPITQKEIKHLFNHLKASASKRNISFDLTLTELNDLSFPITCPVLNIPLYYHRGAPQDDSYSIGRIDSSGGYNIDNIIVVSNRVNKLKSDATLDEMHLIVNYYDEIGGRRRS